MGYKRVTLEMDEYMIRFFSLIYQKLGKSKVLFIEVLQHIFVIGPKESLVDIWKKWIERLSSFSASSAFFAKLLFCIFLTQWLKTDMPVAPAVTVH